MENMQTRLWFSPNWGFTLCTTHLYVSDRVSSSWSRGSDSRSMMHSNSCRSSNSRRSTDMCWHIASSSFPCSGVRSSRSSFSTLSKASWSKKKKRFDANDEKVCESKTYHVCKSIGDYFKHITLVNRHSLPFSKVFYFQGVIKDSTTKGTKFTAE